jgi:beta-lactamase class A
MTRMPIVLMLASLIMAVMSGTHAHADELAERVAVLTKDFKGSVALYALNLDTGQEFAIDPDEKVRTASTIKLPILCALESLVAAGKVRWDETITVRKDGQVSGSGVLADFSDGTTLPLRDVAVLMIVVSDNTATNLVLDRIGTDAVNDYLDTLGLTATRVLRKVRGDKTPPSGWSKAGRVPDNEKYGLGVSTSREMVRLLQLLHQGKVVSREASKDVLDIMRRQQIKDGLGRHAPDAVASKSGALDALRSDVGIVDSAKGRIAIAITVDRMPVVDYSPDNVGDKLIWDISRAIVEAFSR